MKNKKGEKMRRELLINEKELKVLAEKALNIQYEKISIEYADDEWEDSNIENELIIKIQQGHFIELISFSDERILKELNLKELNLELDYVLIYENAYAYKVDATDEQKVYLFYCNELDTNSNVA